MFLRHLTKTAVVWSLALGLLGIVFADVHWAIAQETERTTVPAEYADGAKLECAETIFRVSWGIGHATSDTHPEPIKG